MWHRHAGLLEFHCVVSTFIWSHLLPLNLFKRLNVSGNEAGLSGQITTSKEYHSSPTIEQKKDVYRALFAQFYRLSGIFAHPVGTGSTSNNSSHTTQRSMMLIMLKAVTVMMMPTKEKIQAAVTTNLMLIMLKPSPSCRCKRRKKSNQLQ